MTDLLPVRHQNPLSRGDAKWREESGRTRRWMAGWREKIMDHDHDVSSVDGLRWWSVIILISLIQHQR